MERAKTTCDRGCVEVNGRGLIVRGAFRREERSEKTAASGSHGDPCSRPSLRAEAPVAWILHVAIICVLFSVAPLHAQEVVLALDPAQTQIKFNLGDVLHQVNGTFRLKSGSIRFNRATGSASGSVVVDATSGKSGSNARDRKMHKDILESARYPEIVFTPDRVQGRLASQGESQVEVHGILRLHGADHETTLTARVSVSGDQLSVDTKFVVPYVKWGLKNPSTFVLRVSQDVEIDIHAIGRLTTSSPNP